MSIGVNAVVLVFGLVPSGLAGTSILLYYVFDHRVPLGVIYLVINIPVFILGWREHHLRHTVISFIGMLMLSFLLEATKGISLELPENDVLKCIMAGVILGVGIGVVVRAGGSGGGQRILAMYMKKKFAMPTSTTFNVVNGLNLLGALFYANLDILLYSALYMWVFGIVFEKLLTSFSQKRAVQIITDQPEEVAQAIMRHMHRGVTFFDAVGAFSNKKLKVIYCIIHLHQLGQIKELLFECDPQAFLAVYVMSEAVGGHVSPSVTWENEGYRKKPALFKRPMVDSIAKALTKSKPSKRSKKKLG